jgi:hypothetical protein
MALTTTAKPSWIAPTDCLLGVKRLQMMFDGDVSDLDQVEPPFNSQDTFVQSIEAN